MADAVAKLLRGGSGGVFYLHGEDEYQKRQAVKALVDHHLDPATQDFNLDRLRGREVGVEQLASVLGTPPMMAEWRVVVVTEVEAFAGSPRAKEVLLAAVKAPPPGLVLILSCTVPSGSKAKFYSQLSAGARSVQFRALSADDVPGWLMERAREFLGVEMEPAAARALGQAVGTDLGVLSQELDKLAGYVQEGQPITRDDVLAAGTYLPTQDRWGWIDLVGQRRFSEALTSLRVLMGQGESAVGLVISLGTHLLRLGVVQDRGPAALEAILPPRQRWVAGSLARQAKGWRSDEVAQAVDGLRTLDRRLKSSGGNDESLIQTWLLERMAWSP